MTLATLCAVSACTRDPGGGPLGDTAESMIGAPGSVSVSGTRACYVSSLSVLARAPGTPAPGPDNLRGWIHFERFSAGDSGAARLVDSDGFTLDASWERRNDSVLVAGFNDFVRIEMRLRVTDSGARGSLRAHSDAALERDSTGKLREFQRDGTIRLRQAPCDSMPTSAGGAAIDVLPHGTPRGGVRFDPSTARPGARVGVLVLDSIDARQAAAADSTYVGVARFMGKIEVSGWTLRHPDPDLYRVVTCFEADSASAIRLPRWSGDERRAWFCFENRAAAARALGPPSEGLRATILVDRFTIQRGLSDEVNSARFLRLVGRRR